MKKNMKTNKEYLLDNLDFDIPISFWVMYLDNFFGKEKAEEFYEYLINARDIKRKNDIRNLMSSIGFSIYDLSHNEQLAFISVFKPFDTERKLVENMPNGVDTIFKYYKKRNMELVKDIKKLGYSYEYQNLIGRIENLEIHIKGNMFLLFLARKIIVQNFKII